MWLDERCTLGNVIHQFPTVTSGLFGGSTCSGDVASHARRGVPYHWTPKKIWNQAIKSPGIASLPSKCTVVFLHVPSPFTYHGLILQAQDSRCRSSHILIHYAGWRTADFLVLSMRHNAPKAYRVFSLSCTMRKVSCVPIRLEKVSKFGSQL